MKRQQFVKHVVSSESLQKRKAMLQLAESELPILPDDLDHDVWLLNLSNGTYNLKTGTIQEHKRENLITKKIDVSYNKDASCPIWLNFLNKIFNNNSETINFVKKAIGYSLTGSTQEQCIFILYGIGCNGKSTLINIVKEILGDYSQQTPSETLMVRKYTGNVPNDIASLKGVRFVSSVETDEGRGFAESLVKQLTGDDFISARFLRQEFFEFKPECKIWLASNHKPQIRGTDHAIWRRIRLIPFTVTIPEEEKDFNLLDKLRSEKEGILSWAIDGCWNG
jgi:putative DNA primase/helicase